MTSGLAQYAQRVLTSADPSEKVRLTQEAAKAWTKNRIIGERQYPPTAPSRPSQPTIVKSGDMPTMKECKCPSNVYYLHGLAHVELNAIDLCFDTMLRFATGLEDEQEEEGGGEGGELSRWYDDWISIAADEARHFSWLEARLRALGSFYGALPAHGLIWEGAEVSKGSRRERVAVGQLVAEARGLDAGPRLASRLLGTGDKPSADIVHVIAEEEVRHVQIGVKWFLRECRRAQVDAIKEFHTIAIRAANPGAFIRPFNEERRAAAGLTPDWYLPVATMIEEMRAERRRSRMENAHPVTPLPTSTISETQPP